MMQLVLLLFAVAVTLAAPASGLNKQLYRQHEIVPVQHAQGGMCQVPGVGASCSLCTFYTGICGWCESTKTCMDGNAKGPFFGKCTKWTATPKACKVKDDPCKVVNPTNCSSCVNAHISPDWRCGWCEKTQKCMSGTELGPADGSVCAGWSISEDTCPGAISTCELNTKCTDCTNAGGCVWCASTNKCVAGGFFGATTGTCARDVMFYFDQCPDVCPTLSDNCTTCLNGYGCTWCESTKKCMAGGIQGPASGTCADWHFWFWECPLVIDEKDFCADYQNCSSCASDWRCGWCSNTGTCMRGNSKGPYWGECTNWKLNVYQCAGSTKKFATCESFPPNGCGTGYVLNINTQPLTRICAGSTCKKSECCTPTCATFKGACPAGTKKTTNSGHWCILDSGCTAAECCSGSCSGIKSKCPKGTAVNTKRSCYGRPCVAADMVNCCQATCASFPAKQCPKATPKRVSATKKCLNANCTAIECCKK